jgi:hypothetical protein
VKPHKILFLAADPNGTDRLGFDREARSIQRELEMSGRRDWFQIETRWAAEPLDLLREIRKLKPTVVHLVGHGGPNGILFQTADGRARVVTAEAFGKALNAAGGSVKLVVLRAGYSEADAEVIRAHVDCVVWIDGAIHQEAARSFAVGFYGGLCDCEPVAVAHEQGQAAINLDGLAEGDRPQLMVRDGIDASTLLLTAEAR